MVAITAGYSAVYSAPQMVDQTAALKDLMMAHWMAALLADNWAEPRDARTADYWAMPMAVSSAD